VVGEGYGVVKYCNQCNQNQNLDVKLMGSKLQEVPELLVTMISVRWSAVGLALSSEPIPPNNVLAITIITINYCSLVTDTIS
jgi:hypothetical protein